MTNAMTEARQAVVTQLKTITDLTIYGAPPETVTPPGVLIMPGEGTWTRSVTLGKWEVNLTITCLAAMSGANEAALERLEQLVWDVRALLMDVGLCGPVTQPRLVKIGTAELAAADLTLTLHIE